MRIWPPDDGRIQERIRGEDLNFLRGVHVGCADARAVERVRKAGAPVVSDQTLRLRATVNIRWPLLN